MENIVFLVWPWTAWGNEKAGQNTRYGVPRHFLFCARASLGWEEGMVLRDAVAPSLAEVVGNTKDARGRRRKGHRCPAG